MYEKFLAQFIHSIPESDAMHILYAHTYNEKLKNNNMSNTCKDLEEQSQREKYNKIIKLITNKKIKCYYLDSFEELDRKQIYQVFLYVIYSIFGNKDIVNDEIQSFFECLTLNKSNEVLDGYSNVVQNKITGETFYIVQVPSLTNLSAVVCLCHEFIHFHFHINNKEMSTYQYEEILSIYAEKIAAYILQENKFDIDIENKIEAVRLEAIQWHYVTKKQDLEELRKMTTHNSDKNLRRLYEEQNNYFKALAESYGLGYIYAENLFQIYLDNQVPAIKRIYDVLYNDKNLIELLTYYGINTNNKQTFETAKTKIKKILG